MRSSYEQFRQLPGEILAYAGVIGSLITPNVVAIAHHIEKSSQRGPSAHSAIEKGSNIIKGIPGKIIFASNRGESNLDHHQIYEKTLRTGRITALTTGESNNENPEASRDGKRIVFFSDRSGTNQIYEINLQNPHRLKRLTNDGASDYDPTFTPSGAILYKSNKDDGYGDIWEMNANGSSQHNLTPALSQTEEFKPEAVGNNEVVFTSILRAGDDSSSELYALNIRTGKLIRLTDNNIPDWYPAYNAKNGKIAFTSRDKTEPRGADEIFTINTSGKDRTQLTNKAILPNDSDDPSWSPDGRNLAFVNSRGGSYDIYVMDQKGRIKMIDKSPRATSLSDDLSPVFVPNS